ncbi:MAG: hypothetical protein M3P97_02325 [Actinomycetota bacterium]|nr:hypothetical protein [Actinomycetota bacterium]
MRREVVAELEAFIGGESLWDAEALGAMVARLEAEPDSVSPVLAADLGAVLERVRRGPVPVRLAADVEGVVYPRLWKVMEGVWDDLPEAELRTRARVLDARLSPLLEDRR